MTHGRPPALELCTLRSRFAVRGSADSLSCTAMRQALSVPVILGVLICAPPALDATDAALRDANLAWDRGDYVAALTGYLKLLASPESDSVLESIALQTGELYVTTELTADGTAPRFSSDTRYLTYETGSGATRVVRLVSTDAPSVVKSELRGFAASFSPDGSQLVYLKITPTPQIEQEQAAMEGAPASERAQRLAALNQTVAAASRTVIRDLATGRETEIETGTMRKSSPVIAADGVVLFAGGPGAETQIYSVAAGREPKALTEGPGEKVLTELNATGTAAIVTLRGAGGRGGGPGASQNFGILALPDGGWTAIQGSAPSFSADGRSFVYATRTANESQILVAHTSAPSAPRSCGRAPSAWTRRRCRATAAASRSR